MDSSIEQYKRNQSLESEIYIISDINSILNDTLKYLANQGSPHNISKYIYMIELQKEHIDKAKQLCDF